MHGTEPRRRGAADATNQALGQTSTAVDELARRATDLPAAVSPVSD